MLLRLAPTRDISLSTRSLDPFSCQDFGSTFFTLRKQCSPNRWGDDHTLRQLDESHVIVVELGDTQRRASVHVVQRVDPKTVDCRGRDGSNSTPRPRMRTLKRKISSGSVLSFSPPRCTVPLTSTWMFSDGTSGAKQWAAVSTNWGVTREPAQEVSRPSSWGRL